jgi:hypothetical protein
MFKSHRVEARRSAFLLSFPVAVELLSVEGGRLRSLTAFSIGRSCILANPDGAIHGQAAAQGVGGGGL